MTWDHSCKKRIFERNIFKIRESVVFLPYLVRRSNDEFDDCLFLCLLYFLSLFCVSFTNLFFPVHLVLYGVAD
jgi:hypothetical protein